MPIHLQEEGLHEITDFEIVEKAVNDDRIILTCDLDFGDIMAASGDIYPSVVIFRLDDERPYNVNRRLNQVLEEASDDLRRGAIISVEESNYRIRLLPI